MSETAVQSVLVIDDEVNVVNAIKRTLRSEAYEVQVSTDPKEALEIARRIKPVAVVCDMRMPGMSGSEVLAELHRDQPDCVRILLTGYADITSTIAAINDGQIHRYLTKPWNDDELRDVLRQQIELVNLRRERDHLADSLAVKVDELQTLNRELDQRVAARTQEIYQTNLFLENAYKELHDQFLNSVKVFSNLIEMSSPAMAGHGKRVAELARWIAVEMGLPEAEVEDIYVAGLLHDIGKIGLSDQVLTTPFTQLDPTSRVALVKHCNKGQTALMALPELQNIALYVARHHERVDGKGYPDGLSGKDIPRGARVLAVAEDWDELQMGIVATQKLDMQQTLDFIQSAKGKRYDADVVNALPGALVRLQATPRDDEQLIDSELLIPGFVLSRDLYNPEGLLLMAKDRAVSPALVQYLCAVHTKEKISFKVYCKVVAKPNQTKQQPGF